jgi:hypothetical protein
LRAGVEVPTGVAFTGANTIVVAGRQKYAGDWNIGLARVETTN